MPYALRASKRICHMRLEIPGTKRIWHMRLDALSVYGICAKTSKRIYYMRLDHQSAYGICAKMHKFVFNSESSRPRPKLYHLLRCDGTRHKAISRYCPFKAPLSIIWDWKKTITILRQSKSFKMMNLRTVVPTVPIFLLM